MTCAKDIDLRAKPYGHKEYTRHDPKTGKIIIVQAKGVKPTTLKVLPSAQSNIPDEYGELGSLALKNPEKAVKVVNDLTWDLKLLFYTKFLGKMSDVENKEKNKAVIRSIVDDRIRNPIVELITIAQMVNIGRKSKEDYNNVLSKTRKLLNRNIKEVVTAMDKGKLPELDIKTVQRMQTPEIPTTKSCKNLPTIIKTTKEFGLQDVDMVGWEQEARKAAEEARRRKYFLEGKTKPQREAKKALEKMLRKSKNPGAEKLMDGFSFIKALKPMTTKGQGWNRIYNKGTRRTGAITSGINAQQQKFTTRIQMTQRFKKGGRAFDRYVVERVVNGKKTIETHDFDISGKGLFSHGFEGCIREAQSKGYVPNQEQAEKLCGWILQTSGTNVARQGLAVMMGREELKQFGGKAPLISRGKGGKHPIHQKGYAKKILPQSTRMGKQYAGAGGGYSQKQFGGRVSLPPKGKRK